MQNKILLQPATKKAADGGGLRYRVFFVKIKYCDDMIVLNSDFVLALDKINPDTHEDTYKKIPVPKLKNPKYLADKKNILYAKYLACKIVNGWAVEGEISILKAIEREVAKKQEGFRFGIDWGCISHV